MPGLMYFYIISVGLLISVALVIEVAGLIQQIIEMGRQRKMKKLFGQSYYRNFYDTEDDYREKEIVEYWLDTHDIQYKSFKSKFGSTVTLVVKTDSIMVIEYLEKYGFTIRED